MDSKTKLIIGIIAMGIVLVSFGIWNKQSSEDKTVAIILPIDSPEEAISHAITDPEVQGLIEKAATRGINVKKEAQLDKNNNWYVTFYSDETWLGLEINTNGTIMRKGYGI